jgi:uncharacterized protein involved in exopolysaccharide biosynthesis
LTQQTTDVLDADRLDPAPVRGPHGEPATESPARPSVPLVTPRRRLRSRRWIAVVVALLLVAPTAGAAVVSSMQPDVYAVVADLLYRPVETSSPESIERELATQKAVLMSRRVVDPAALAAGMEVKELSKAMEIEVVEESNLLRVRVEDTSRRTALTAATAVLDTYRATIAEQSASATAEEERALLQRQVNTLTAQLNDINTRLGQIAVVLIPPVPMQTESVVLQQEAQLIRDRVLELQNQLIESDVQVLREGAGRVRVLVQPTVLPEPAGPKPLQAAAAGALAGLVLAVGLVALLRLRRERSRPSPT